MYSEFPDRAKAMVTDVLKYTPGTTMNEYRFHIYSKLSNIDFESENEMREVVAFVKNLTNGYLGIDVTGNHLRFSFEPIPTEANERFANYMAQPVMIFPAPQ
jgi:hypothetical protein